MKKGRWGKRCLHVLDTVDSLKSRCLKVSELERSWLALVTELEPDTSQPATPERWLTDCTLGEKKVVRKGHELDRASLSESAT